MFARRELPTPILAETLGIHIHTARRWAGYLQRDWSTYLAERASPDTPAPGTSAAGRNGD